MQVSIQRTTDIVSFGLRSQPNTDGSSITGLPGVACQIITSLDGPSAEECESDFKTWLLLNGLRELFENVNELLEAARMACAKLKFVSQNQNRRIPISEIEEWQSNDATAALHFHKLPIPRKRSQLKNEYSAILETGLEGLIDILGKARNCYVHRQGLVDRDHDCSVDRQLNVKWIGVSVKRFGDDKLIRRPEDADTGGVYEYGSEMKERAFLPGEKLKFTASEFNEIGLTVFVYGKLLVERVLQYAQSELHVRIDDSQGWKEATEVFLRVSLGPSSSLFTADWRDGRLRLLRL